MAPASAPAQPAITARRTPAAPGTGPGTAALPRPHTMLAIAW